MKIPGSILDEIQARTALADLIGGAVVLRRAGREYVGNCPFHAEKTGSFTVNEAKGFYHCFGCGAHGDAIAWMMAQGDSFLGAFADLAAQAGMDVSAWLPAGFRPAVAQRPQLAPPVPRQSAEDIAAERADKARRAATEFARALPAAGSPVETYLRGRGVTCALPPTIRFERAVRHGETELMLPAMLAAVQGPGRQVVGLHRTFLSFDGRTKANVSVQKKMFGPCFGGAVRFAPACEHLTLAEGIETGLTALSAEPNRAIWSALSLGNIAGGGLGRGADHPARPGRFLPATLPDMDRPGIVLPEITRRVTIVTDNDNGDPESARCLIRRATTRFQRMGIDVILAVPPRGMDLNDVLTMAAAE